MRKPTAPRPDVDAVQAWRVTNHACRLCGGRCLESIGPVVAWMCADCEIATDSSVIDICACGERLPNGRDPHVRCARGDQHIPGLGPAVVPEVSC